MDRSRVLKHFPEVDINFDHQSMSLCIAAIQNLESERKPAVLTTESRYWRSILTAFDWATLVRCPLKLSLHSILSMMHCMRWRLACMDLVGFAQAWASPAKSSMTNANLFAYNLTKILNSILMRGMGLKLFNVSHLHSCLSQHSTSAVERRIGCSIMAWCQRPLPTCHCLRTTEENAGVRSQTCASNPSDYVRVRRPRSNCDLFLSCCASITWAHRTAFASLFIRASALATFMLCIEELV